MLTILLSADKNKRQYSVLLCRCTGHRCHRWYCQWHCRDTAHNVDSRCILVHTRHIVLRSNPRDRYSHLRSVTHNKRTSTHTTLAISEADFSPHEYDQTATCGFTMKKNKEMCRTQGSVRAGTSQPGN